MELITMIMTLSLVFGLTLLFLTRPDWKILLTVVPIVFLIPFVLQLDVDKQITYGVEQLGCGQTSNTTFNCQYFTGTGVFLLDANLMTILNYLVFLGVVSIIGYVIAEALALRRA